MKLIKRSQTNKYNYFRVNENLYLIRIDYNPNQPRDARGRWSSGGGGGGGSIVEGLQKKKVSELHAIAKAEGIDVNTLSHKSRKSVLAKAIEAKISGENLREKGLLKPTKTNLRESKKPTKKPVKEVKKPAKLEGYKKNLPKEQQKVFHSTKDSKEFEREFSYLLDKNDDGSNLIPIYKIRQEMGEVVSRDNFNKWLFDMQAVGKIQLLGGSVEDSAPQKIRDSVSTRLGGIRTYIKKEGELLSPTDKEKTAIAAKLKNAPPLDPLGSARKLQSDKKIVSQKEFDQEVAKTFDTLSNEFNERGVVPIWKVREVLGDRVSKKEFDDFVLNKYTPISSKSPDQGDIETKGGIKPVFGSNVRTHLTRDKV